MNYAQLQQLVLDDTHKSQYVGAPIQEMIARAEALITAYLESYNFLAQLSDADRVSAGSPIYNLPAALEQLRYVKISGRPLDKVDETSAFLLATANDPTVYVQRVGQIQIAGTPALTTAIDIDYMGMPAALSLVATNTLLTKYPQLYVEATSHYVYRRAQSYDDAAACLDSFKALVKEINRKTKKNLGGAQAVGPYNVSFRSAY